MKDTYEAEITLKVDVEYEYHRAYRGARSSLGVPEEPDEPAHVEIYSIKLNGEEIILEAFEVSRLEDEIFDSL